MNKGKYTLESLLQSNKYFDSRYRLIQEEVDKVNEHVQLIEQTRSKETPRAGDKVQYTTRYGDYCPKCTRGVYRGKRGQYLRKTILSLYLAG